MVDSVSVRFKTRVSKNMLWNIRIQWNAGTARVLECVLKTLECRGLRVGPFKALFVMKHSAIPPYSGVSKGGFLQGGQISIIGVGASTGCNNEFRGKSLWKPLSLYRIQQGAPAQKTQNLLLQPVRAPTPIIEICLGRHVCRTKPPPKNF